MPITIFTFKIKRLNGLEKSSTEARPGLHRPKTELEVGKFDLSAKLSFTDPILLYSRIKSH